MDTASRAQRLRACLVDAEVDAALVTKPVNVRWLTGFTGSNGLVAVCDDRMLLVTDARYEDQSRTETEAAGVELDIEITTTEVVETISRYLGPGKRIGIEADHLTVGAYRRFQTLGELVEQSAVVETLRQIKDGGEIARLELAARIADEALASALPLLRDGPTERHFGAELDHQMRLAGADDVSFETIVGSGPNGALPHARPSDRVVSEGDLVVLDFGAKIDGYGSDMTRTVCVGEPDATQIDLYDAVRSAQQAGVDAVRAGVDERSIDEACRSVLTDRGFGEAFVHGTGHGIGLEIHEQPILSSRATGILRAGLVVTVEPGAYLPGFGGVRVEDSVIVTGNGCEPITHSPKGLWPDYNAQEFSHGDDDE